MNGGRYQAYPEYKDSGVGWLGCIPSHWERLKFSLLARGGKVFASGPFGSSIGAKFYQDEGVPVIRGNNLSIDGKTPLYNDSGYVFLDEHKAEELSNAEVLPGDLVFTARGTVGQVGLIPDDGSISWSRAILSANQLRFRNSAGGVNSKFLWYLFSSWFVRTQISLSSDSVAQPNLNLGSLRGLNLLLPEVGEQIQIVNFLDHETAKIDTLIEKQQNLIALLKEKRQAVISHAVTKGLNPDAPMKDSGVEWLGEVPEHWEVMRLKHTSTIQSGIPKGKDLVGKTVVDVPMLRVANVQDGYLDLQEVHNISIEPEQLERYKLVYGDVLMNEGGDNDKLGRGAVWRSEIATCIHQNHVFAIRPHLIEPEWLDLVTRAEYAKFHFYRVSKQSTNLASISSSNIKETPLTVPPEQERKAILESVERKLLVIDQVQNKCTCQIKLLQERRTALISAAVTGKIDVRNWQPPAAPASAEAAS